MDRFTAGILLLFGLGILALVVELVVLQFRKPKPKSKPDPLVDRDCAYLDGTCECKSTNECRHG